VSSAPREAAEVFDWGAFLGVLPWTVLAVVVVLGVTLAVALGQGRHTVVDVAWGLGFVAIAVAAFLAGDGDPGRSWLVLALTAGWGLRLGAHIHRRSRGRGEDPRYEELLAKAPPGGRTAFAVRRIYLTQGVVMWFVSLPVQVAMVQPQGLGALAWAGAAVWAVGLFFETVGDWQLERFRAEQPGPRPRHRPVALHPSPQLLRRRLRVVGAVAGRRERVARGPLRPLPARHDLEPRQGHRRRAAREGHRRPSPRLRRLRPPHQRLRPTASSETAAEGHTLVKTAILGSATSPPPRQGQGQGPGARRSTVSSVSAWSAVLSDR
jgi:hypothetical protein